MLEKNVCEKINQYNSKYNTKRKGCYFGALYIISKF